MTVFGALRVLRAWMAFALGAVLGIGAAVGITAFGPAHVAAAATARTAPVPVIEQNLNSAGRIRVALPGGFADTAGGPGYLIQTPWQSDCNGCWITPWSATGPGIFRGMALDISSFCNYNCGPAEDGLVQVIVDGQQVFYMWFSWAGGTWDTTGSILGGTFQSPCGQCSTMHWFPPGGITFQHSLQVMLMPSACCGLSGANTAAYFGQVWYTTIPA